MKRKKEYFNDTIVNWRIQIQNKIERLLKQKSYTRISCRIKNKEIFRTLGAKLLEAHLSNSSDFLRYRGCPK